MVMILALVFNMWKDVTKEKKYGSEDEIGKGDNNQDAKKVTGSIVDTGCVWFYDASL